MGKVKKYDLVRLINDGEYKKYGVKNNSRGILLEKDRLGAKVLFFNPKNVGEYVIAEIKNEDLAVEKEKLPKTIADELELKKDRLIKKASAALTPIKIKEYSLVKLAVDKPEYEKFGIRKGNKGCVMNNAEVNDYIEVDFSYIDENGEYRGDCIAVKISDLVPSED